MTQTPQANRTTIALVGRRNAGKSTLINQLTGQDVALVSPYPGTTTDPVYKASELHPLGSVLYIDTAGLDDEGELGELRVKKSLETLKKANAIILLIKADQATTHLELEWLASFKKFNIPLFIVMSASDLVANSAMRQEELSKLFNTPVIATSQQSPASVDQLKSALVITLSDDEEPMIGHALPKGSVVVLVMPQDIQAPKGRLILPQVQVLRELLDFNHRALCATFDQLSETLALLKEPPALIITDSQLFGKVKPLLSNTQPLTSFSILMASRKGDLAYYTEGAIKINDLKPGDKVLILEACSHHALKNDIGRHQIPQKIAQHIGGSLDVQVHTGGNLPPSMDQFKLVIQCGSCMINRAQNMNRLNELKTLGLPVTNYGLALAFLSGQLEHVINSSTI